MKLKYLFLALLLHSTKCSIANTNSSVFLFISQHLEENNADMCYFFTCWPNRETKELNKILSDINIRSSFVKSDNEIKRALTEKKVTYFCYVLDLSCRKFTDLLETVATHLNFRMTSTWLILADYNNATPQYWQNRLNKIEVRMDSKIRIAVPADDESYKILDAYNPGFKIGGKAIIKEIGFWDYSTGLQINKNLSFYEDRKNMSSVIIRSGSVVLLPNHSGTFHDYMLDTKTKHLDTMSKFHYTLFLLLQEMHGFAHNLTIADKWFGNKQTGIDDGVCKLLYEDKVDVTSTGATQRVPRIYVIDYLMPSYHFRPVYIFRNPGVYDPFTNEFLKPFSLGTWCVVLSSAAIICISLKLVYWAENKYLHLSTMYSWTTPILITISAIFQQGSSIFPQHFAGRFIFLILLLMSFILYNYYTSCIISSLLSKPPPSFNSLDELGHSNLEIGIENLPYTITWFKIINNSDVQYIHKNKVLRLDLEYNTYNVDEGIARIRQGGFAFHTQADSGYPVIARNFDQEAICDLDEVRMIPPSLAGILVQKKSQYAEMFHISLRKMKQAGLVHRNGLIWESKKPACLSSAIVSSVSIEQTLIAFLCLIMGIILSLLFLLIEIFWFRLGLDDKFN